MNTKKITKKMKQLLGMLFVLLSLPIYAQVGLEVSVLKGSGIDSSKDFTLALPNGIQSNSYEAFVHYEKLCKKQIYGACLAAGKISRLDPPPKQIFDLPESRRIAISLQLLERAIDGGDLESMEMAYDIYYIMNPVAKTLATHADDARANELLKMMLDRNHPGGLARQAYIYLVSPSYLTDFAKKKEACLAVRHLLDIKNLTDSSKKLVEDLNSGNTYLLCKMF